MISEEHGFAWLPMMLRPSACAAFFPSKIASCAFEVLVAILIAPLTPAFDVIVEDLRQLSQQL